MREWKERDHDVKSGNMSMYIRLVDAVARAELWSVHTPSLFAASVPRYLIWFLSARILKSCRAPTNPLHDLALSEKHDGKRVM